MLTLRRGPNYAATPYPPVPCHIPRHTTPYPHAIFDQLPYLNVGAQNLPQFHTILNYKYVYFCINMQNMHVAVLYQYNMKSSHLSQLVQPNDTTTKHQICCGRWTVNSKYVIMYNIEKLYMKLSIYINVVHLGGLLYFSNLGGLHSCTFPIWAQLHFSRLETSMNGARRGQRLLVPTIRIGRTSSI